MAEEKKDVVETVEKPTAKKKSIYAKTVKFNGVDLNFTKQGRYADGRKVPYKNLTTMKALKVDVDGNVTGGVTQLPWEATINNGVVGEPADQIGLKRYERKGFIFCVNTDGTPMFSTLWDDWSEYDAAYENKIRAKFKGEGGNFSQNATTTKTMSGV